MGKVNFLVQWKNQLNSKDKKAHLVALMELVELFNSVDEEIIDSVLIQLINSDIFYFLSEIMTYHDKCAMCLINKIVCHLSEVEEFFKNDFFRILKGYTRVLHSFPSKQSKSIKIEKYHQDILTCMGLFVKRARDHGCNFSDDRMSLNSLIIAISNLADVHFRLIPAVDFTNLIIELLIAVPAKDEKDSKLRNENVLKVLKKLNEDKQLLESTTFMLLQGKILHNTLSFIVSGNDATIEHKALRNVIVDKFLVIMDFILLAKNSMCHYEIFCNMLYYIMTSDKLRFASKLQLINRFISLRGHHFAIKVITDDNHIQVVFKSKVVIAEVLNACVSYMNKLTESSEALRRKSYEIVFNADFKKMNPIDDDPSTETMLMYTFMKFIDFVWKQRGADKCELLSNTSLILAKFKARKISVDPSFHIMLVTLLTSTFQDVSIKGNRLLQISSAAILESAVHLKKFNLNYLKWWQVMGKPKTQQFDELVIKFLGQNLEDGSIDRLHPRDLEMFSPKLLTKTLFSPSASPIVQNNVKTILCQLKVFKTSKQYTMLLTELKKLQLESTSKNSSIDEKIFRIIDILGASCSSIEDQGIKKATAMILANILKGQSSDLLKLASVNAATSLMRYKFT